MKKLYVYEDLDVCDPGSGAYHEWGGLVVVTAGDPGTIVKPGTGDEVKGEGGTQYVLPEPSHVYVVPDDSPDAIIVFPNAGCC